MTLGLPESLALKMKSKRLSVKWLKKELKSEMLSGWLASGIREPGMGVSPIWPRRRATRYLESGPPGTIKEPAFPPPPFFRGTGLVIDHDGDAGRFPQFALDRIQVVPMMDGNTRREASIAAVFFRYPAFHRYEQDIATFLKKFDGFFIKITNDPDLFLIRGDLFNPWKYPDVPAVRKP